MQIYADPITVNCRKVLAGLDFLDAPFERIHVDYFKGEQKEPAYVAVNPNASVPALRDGDFTLWESNAILQYAADKLGREAAYPRDLQQRADVNRWLLWESSSWFPSTYVFLIENCVKPLLGGQPTRRCWTRRPCSSTSWPASWTPAWPAAAGSAATTRPSPTSPWPRPSTCMPGRSCRCPTTRTCSAG